MQIRLPAEITSSIYLFKSSVLLRNYEETVVRLKLNPETLLEQSKGWHGCSRRFVLVLFGFSTRIWVIACCIIIHCRVNSAVNRFCDNTETSLC